ncbi:glycosyltransferase family 4 protein [Myceligenerans pegani]|uniref:D-inositol 3-phosphate glycosyltransferase n=1 Tax=Myceligenerans pegani TaxID=2776917 RepID=A0ABR9MZE8_9MICO|nr:glycosyltransferase family 4 protein [Myceligenerans sp. TRM 65318]MBE1876778.1 glycosyltransferase family 4 protein [Myceligenerans sp. TRM 65318]MBE3019049.1 glycosyltransferase family 4 protein [Myceligenerans sp. TRM 65318]
MRIGIVCPYSFDAPGGVQFHVRDLARALRAAGHDVSVLAPASEDTPVPEFVVPAGRAVPIRYNGSVARLTFGPVTARRVRRWLAEGEFDVVHLHEPMTPSVSLLALRYAEVPLVATCHSSMPRSRALRAAFPLTGPFVEKIAGRIAVSEDARRTVVDHLGGDAVVIPNGVFTQDFAHARPRPEWQGASGAPTIAFLGRLDEPRKGLDVLLAAAATILDRLPGARFLVAGSGTDVPARVRAALGEHAHAVELLGRVTDEEKASLLVSADLYVAPQTGGESFGIVLVEAMSAGAVVVASELGAFRRVLDDGAAGALFATGDPEALAAEVVALAGDPERRERYRNRAREAVRAYDWSVVTGQVLAVYETVLSAGDVLGPRGRLPGLADGVREVLGRARRGWR